MWLRNGGDGIVDGGEVVCWTAASSDTVGAYQCRAGCGERFCSEQRVKLPEINEQTHYEKLKVIGGVDDARGRDGDRDDVWRATAAGLAGCGELIAVAVHGVCWAGCSAEIPALSHAG